MNHIYKKKRSPDRVRNNTKGELNKPVVLESIPSIVNEDPTRAKQTL